MSTLIDGLNTMANLTNGNGRPTTRYSQDGYVSEYGNDKEPHFRISDDFIAGYATRKPKFGYNGLGEFVFYRTYSRIKEDGTKESFLDVIRRVVEGCYEIQRRYCRKIHVPWDYDKAELSAREMFERMWSFKFLPPGRGLWCMGTKFMWERGSAAINNCAFVSTQDIQIDPAEPFCFLMDMSMLGVGVGFDTRGANVVRIMSPYHDHDTVYQIPDSREGWVLAVRVLIDSYTTRPDLGNVKFDFSKIRRAGLPIKGFGGVASGPAVLQQLLAELSSLLNKYVGRVLDSVGIVDIMNIIGAAVVAGNVRRSAEIAFGDIDDLSYATMKDPCYGLHPVEVAEFRKVESKLYSEKRVKAELKDFEGCLISPEKLQRAIDTWNGLNNYRWASNNSVFAKVGTDYTVIGRQAGVNGEPGFLWLDNIRNYGRLIDGEQPGIDDQAMGANPCGEQALESYELCNLVETFPANHDDADDYLRTLKFAYLYAKTVTLLPTHNPRTNSVTLRNRRIGLSQSGIIQAFQKFGRRRVLREFCDCGYKEICRWDKTYSRWLCVPESIKKTSVKPSGTVSLVVGAWPGIHHQEHLYYWRRVRLAKSSPLIRILREANYEIEQCLTDEHTMVVKFGVIEDEHLRPVHEVSVWEQVSNVVAYQTYWADNQPSCTVKVKPHEIVEIPRVLSHFDDQLKCITFLPLNDHGYQQAPYEPAEREVVAAYLKNIKQIDFDCWVAEEAVGSKYCDGDTCLVNGI